MARACAISLGTELGEHNGYTLVDGTGTWCGWADGAAKLTLRAALERCAEGSYQGRQAPCVGVVFNAAQRGDVSSEDGKFTTCCEPGIWYLSTEHTVVR